MIINTVPHQAKFIPSSNTFTAQFGVPTIGVYDFTNTAANQYQTVIPFRQSMVYYIDSINIGGTLSNQDYLSAIGILPTLKFTRKISREIIYSRVLPIATFAENSIATVFCKSDKGGDEMQLSLEGVLNMTPALVGIGSLSINISCKIFEIAERDYNIAFRDTLTSQYSQRLRG